MLETILSCVISGIFSCLVVAIPINLQHKNDRKTQMEVINDSMRCSLRNDILTIYEENKSRKCISLFQKQAIHYSYEQYKKLNGNSFVDQIVKEIDNWTIMN